MQNVEVFALPEDLERIKNLAPGQMGLVRVINNPDESIRRGLKKFPDDKILSGDSLIKRGPEEWEEVAGGY
jgi:hypothetical protein